MRKNRIVIAALLVMVMLLSVAVTALAASDTPADPDDQRQTGIVGGDELTFTEDTVWVNFTARWGVRVIFRDGDKWNNAEIKNELLPVTDSESGSTTAPADPSHEGWTFTGWERVDGNKGPSTLNDDGTVTGVNGPGPIIYQAAYKPIGSNPGGPSPKPAPPVLNTTDHYAYIIGRNNEGGYVDRGQTVNPEAPITRAETVTIFFRMLTDESRDALWSTANTYTDVTENDWYNNAVSTMANGGIVTGYPDGSFDPNGNITRAEFAAMAIRFFQDAKAGPAKFSDTIGHWAEESISKAQSQGLIAGYPDGSFQPDEPITRAEAMTLMNRVLERHPHKDHLLPVPEMITWPDNMDTGKWYYAQVQEATNSHTYHAPDAEHDYESWIEELPVRDWAAFERMWSDSHSASNPGNVIDNK